MFNINELIGVIKGIKFDGVINDMEVACLQAWVDKNRNLTYDKQQAAIIELIDTVLEQHIITYDERKQLLYFEQYLKGTTDDTASIYELNGIIKRIVCDGVVNTEEVFSLKQWMDEKGPIIRRQKLSEEILDLVKDILADGEVTETEQKQLLKLLNDRISDTQLKTKINYIRSMVKERKNIGLDLIDILDNENAIDLIHHEAETQLRRALFSYSGMLLGDPEIVFISLCLIGMQEYDGNFYENVRTTYVGLYQSFSEQKIEGTIRTILNRYRIDEESTKEKSRIINVALSNAIVPAHFLPAFFEFIFDIYKLNFEYDLPVDLYEEFQFVYEGLRNNMLSDGDGIQLNVTKKSYKLIKTTKQLIVEEKYIDSVIKLSIIIVKLIDKRIWENEIKIFNPYFKVGYEKWESTLRSGNEEKKRARTTGEFRSHWEPKFQMEKNDIYLVPPIHRVKAQYNYSDIAVVVRNNDEIVCYDDRPDIREIIGGYQVSIKKVKLKQPLGKISYLLVAGEEVIYDSKDKLYRNYLVFDETGYEIHNNTDYKGIAVICTSPDEFQPYFKSQDYGLTDLSIQYGDTLLLGNEVFSFSSLIKPGVFGDEIVHQYLKKDGTEELLTVYSDVKFLIFESENDTEMYEIVINNRSYRLSDFHYTRTKRQASWKYVVDLGIDDPGIYVLSIYEIFDGKRVRVASFRFGFDPSFQLEELKIDDYSYMVSVRSALSDRLIDVDIDVRSFSEDWLKVEKDGECFSYLIPLHFDIYRIRGKAWQPLTETLWIGDIEQSSVIEFFGTEIDSLVIYSDSGGVLQEGIQTKDCGSHREIAAGFLASYRESNSYIVLVLLNSGKREGAVFCYNRCIFNYETTEINFDPITKKLYVLPYYYGKGNVAFEVIDEEETVVYKGNYLESGIPIEVQGLKSFVNYQLYFYEKLKGLSLQKNRELMRTVTKFYAREDFIGRFFKVKEVQFDQRVRGEFLRKSHYFNRVYVHFTNRISDDVFEGNVVVKTATGIFDLFNINPVEIEICSAIMNEEIELSVTKDGDGLFLDFEHHGIMNTLDDDTAIDIFSYTIDANGVQTL